MDIYSLFQGGENRIYIPYPIYFVMYCAPTAILALLTSSTLLSTRAKQFLSVPILIVTLLIPLNFTAHQRMIDLGASAICFNTFLRFFEFNFIGPVVQGRPAYADMNYLYDQLWYCLFDHPKKSNAKNEKKDEKKQVEHTDSKESEKTEEKPAEPVRDKKFYHILIRLGTCVLMADILGSWFYTYNAEDLTQIRSERPVLYLVFFAMAILLLTIAFDMIGYTLQLLHCLYYQYGSYASNQYRRLMKDPVLSTSLDELWSVRWHQLFHTTWVAFAFRPTFILTQRALAKHIKNPKPIAMLVAVSSVFVVSALMHEYIIYTNIGWTVYRQFFLGQQMFFFTIHGIATALERFVSSEFKRHVPEKYRNPIITSNINRICALIFSFFTFQYFIDGFAYWGIWHSNPFIYTRPVVQGLLRAIPGGRQVCGSLLA